MRDFKPNAHPPGGGHKSKRDVPGPMTDGKRTSNERHIGGDGSRGGPRFSWLPGEDGVGLQEERGGTVCPTPDLVAGGCDGRRPGGAGVPASGGQGRPRGAGVRAFGGGGRRVHERVRDHLRGIATAKWRCLSYPRPSCWWQRRTTAGRCWRACVRWTITVGS